MPAVTLFPRVLDFGLNVLDSETDRLLVCSSPPTDYASATAAALGFKSATAGLLFGSPADYADGRKIASNAITDGTITTSGTVSCWAAIDAANSRLHAVGNVAASGPVTTGQGFTLTSFTIDLSGKFALAVPPNWWLTDSTIDLDLEDDLIYDSASISTWNGADTFLSCSRASIGYAKTAAGTLTLFGTRTNEIKPSLPNAGNWSRDHTTQTYTGAGAPDGTSTVVRTTETSGTAGHAIFSSPGIINGVVATSYSVSIFVKDGNRGFVQLTLMEWTGFTAIFASFDLSNGTVSDTGANGTWVFSSASAEAIGNGWWRLSVNGTCNTTNALVLYMEMRPDATTGSYAGNTGTYIDVWGGQIEKGSYASSYIPTTTAAASRDQLRITDLGLLVEDARENKVWPSGDLRTSTEGNSVAKWQAAGTSATSSGTAPSGDTATLIAALAGSSAHRRYSDPFTFTSNPVSISCFCKAGGSNWVYIGFQDLTDQGAYFNLSSGSVGTLIGTTTATIEAYANGWYRCSVVVGVNNARYPSIMPCSADNQGFNYTSSGTESIYAFGMQAELGAFSSSYIPTTTTAATRAADAVNFIGNATTLLTAMPQSIVVDLKTIGTALISDRIIGDDSTATAPLFFYSDTVIGTYDNAVVLTATIGNSLTFTGGAKVGYAQATGYRSVVGGGGTVGTDANSANVPTTPTIGSLSGAYHINAYFRRVTLWNRKLADATLQSYTDPATALAFPADINVKVDLDFVNDEYYAAPVITDYLSISRASTGYAKTAAGTLKQFASNILRITDLGLLIEDARTNLQPYSQDMVSGGGGGWSNPNLQTITLDDTVAPDGTITADKISPGGNVYSGTTINPTANTRYSLSVYLKLDVPNSVSPANVTFALYDGFGSDIFGVVCNLSTGIATSDQAGTGVLDSYTSEPMANGWYRFSCTGYFTGNKSNMYLNFFSSGGTVTSYWLWGVQLEQASFPSSYIPTTTAAATRAKDTITCIGNLDAVLGVLPQTAVVDLISNANQAYHDSASFTWILGTASQALIRGAQYFQATDIGTGAYSILTVTTGNSRTWFTGLKLGEAQDASPSRAVAGGGALHSDTTVGSGAPGSFVGSGDYLTWYGYFRRLTVWNSRLADATLQGLTAP